MQPQISNRIRIGIKCSTKQTNIRRATASQLSSGTEKLNVLQKTNGLCQEFNFMRRNSTSSRYSLLHTFANRCEITDCVLNTLWYFLNGNQPLFNCLFFFFFLVFIVLVVAAEFIIVICRLGCRTSYPSNEPIPRKTRRSALSKCNVNTLWREHLLEKHN